MRVKVGRSPLLTYELRLVCGWRRTPWRRHVIHLCSRGAWMLLYLAANMYHYSHARTTVQSGMPAPRPPPSIFPLDPSLSYPLFETYRLASQPTQEDVHTYQLPAAHHAVGWNARYPAQASGYKEVKKRVEWDALSRGAREDEVLYVDAEWNVVRVRLVCEVGRTGARGDANGRLNVCREYREMM